MKPRPKRILVIEDEEPLQEMFRESLSPRGHCVETADNGRLGFRAGATYDYDYILCDLFMPEWNGVDAIKALLMVKPQTRFIVISAYADRCIADELRAIAAVKQIFMKPANIMDVIACVEAD